MEFEVRHGSFSYPGGREVLHDISFTFGCTGVMSVLGANGAGKTTLLKCMLGLRRWSSGATLIDGVDIRRMTSRELWKRIGYVPQAKLTNFAYKVEDLVVMGRSARLSAFAKPGKADWAKAYDAMEAVGVSKLAGKACDEISGGEYQLALVARALCGEPELLILDEPESNLDFRNQLRVLQVLKSLSRERGIGAIINTHFPAHALEISDVSLVMRPGKPPLVGRTREVLTEATLTESFGIPVRILDVNLPERPGYACVTAIPAETSRS